MAKSCRKCKHFEWHPLGVRDLGWCCAPVPAHVEVPHGLIDYKEVALELAGRCVLYEETQENE